MVIVMFLKVDRRSEKLVPISPKLQARTRCSQMPKATNKLSDSTGTVADYSLVVMRNEADRLGIGDQDHKVLKFAQGPLGPCRAGICLADQKWTYQP
jgi:hypothetical protein